MDGRVGRVHRRAGNRGLSGRRRYGGRAGWPATDGALGGGGAASRAPCRPGTRERVLVRVSTVRGRRDNPGRVEQLGGNFDVIIDGVGGATLGLAVEHVAARGVVVNIATQPGDETVSFRAKCFDRARGAAIYTLNLPDELASHASAASDLTAPSRPAVPASPAPHPAAHRTCCRTAHPQIPQRRRLDSSMVAPASRPPINPPDGSAGPAAPKPPKICPD